MIMPIVLRRGESADSAIGGAQAGADAGGLWGTPGRHSSPAGISAQPGGEPGGLGGLAPGSVPAWAGGQAAGLDRHRRLSRFGGGDSDRLSTGASSALLGAQNAQYFRQGAQVRPRRSEEWRSGYLFGGEPGPGRSRLRAFRARWRRQYAAMVRRLERDLPELLSFFAFPRHLWRKLRTTNVIERCFVEVRRRTRPMVCFVNVESVDRIIYSIFQRFNLEWKTRTLNLFTQAA